MIKCFGVHGDNIVECTRTRDAMAQAMGVHPLDWQEVKGPIWAPQFTYHLRNSILMEVKLYAGHGRHGGAFLPFEAGRGASAIGEHPDAYLTDDTTGRVLVAMEYCGALPAGNNAWQRSGRAWALGMLRIPYLFVAELAGYELDESGQIKAPRIPSLIVPASFLTFGASIKEACAVIYLPAATAKEKTVHEILSLGGPQALKQALGDVLTNDAISPQTRVQVAEHQLATMKWLESVAARKGIIHTEEWKAYSEAVATGEPGAEYWLALGAPFAKKLSRGKWPDEALRVVDWVSAHAVQVGGEFPGCLLLGSARSDLADQLEANFGKDAGDDEFWRFLRDGNKPLGVSLLAGFKPQGEDSRPDRGVNPLFKMLVPDDSYDLLTLLYGPARKDQIRLLGTDLDTLAAKNGLWRTAINLGQVIGYLGQSAVARVCRFVVPKGHEANATESVIRPPTGNMPFGEHDIDTVLHLLMESHVWPKGHEALCNPPGGDWSGVSLVADATNRYRWSSLPRAPKGVKRPDHVFQTPDALLSIESKGLSVAVPDGVGLQLTRYLEDLLSRPATAHSQDDGETWKLYGNRPAPMPGHDRLLSAIAFEERAGDDLDTIRGKAGADLAIGISFDRPMGTTEVRLVGMSSSQYFKLWGDIAERRLNCLVHVSVD